MRGKPSDSTGFFLGEPFAPLDLGDAFHPPRRRDDAFYERLAARIDGRRERRQIIERHRSERIQLVGHLLRPGTLHHRPGVHVVAALQHLADQPFAADGLPGGPSLPKEAT